MDYAIAIGIFVLFLVVPAFMRSRKHPRRRIVERIFLGAFVLWLAYALRAFIK
jgi:hypothetical protein